MRHLSIAIIAALALAATGCMTVNASLPGAIRNDKPETEKVAPVSIEKGNYFFLWGLVGSPPADFFAADLKKEVESKGGDGVANLQYESSDGCLDLIITGCTGGCVAPRTYKLTGDIVHIKKDRLPGKPAKTADNTKDGEPAKMVAQGY